MSEKDNQKRVTKKSRTVEEFVSAIIDLAKAGEHDISKAELVDEVVKTSIVAGTSKAVSDLLASELANLLDNYFSDIIRAAGDELKLPYHLTSRAWYKPKAQHPQTEEEAREYVVVFGNGNTGRAAGVRYVTPEDEPDPMLLVSLSKRIDVVNSAIKTRNARLITDLKSASVAPAIGAAMSARLPQIETITEED